MKNLVGRFCFLGSLLLLGANAFAGSSKGGFGASAGFGLPFLSQVGLNYQFNDKFGMYAGYNMLSVTSGTASAKLSMPELMLNYHPFSGSYFLGIGAGQENLKTNAKDTLTGAEASIEITAITMLVKTGWMWGVTDGGLWFGIDLEYISPSSSTETITAPGIATTDQVYIDALDAAQKFGKTAYINLTFARLGYIF